jgi:hypothetical protein
LEGGGVGFTKKVGIMNIKYSKIEPGRLLIDFGVLDVSEVFGTKVAMYCRAHRITDPHRLLIPALELLIEGDVRESDIPEEYV